MSSAYSPELCAPGKMPELDPLQPSSAWLLRAMRRKERRLTAAFQPGEGLRCRQIRYPSADGAEICAWVIEPAGEGRALPGLLLIHGGAFCLPLMTSTLALACAYVRRLPMRVFLPDYRLTPEFAGLTLLEDCRGLWRAMRDHSGDWLLDPDRLLVLGESAGGALAAGLCLCLRDRGEPLPRGQLLIYPALDDRPERYASYTRYPEACWTPRANAAMWRAFLREGEERALPWLVPMRCGQLRGLPPAYVEPQEIDVLCDEAVAYAEALRAAGVPTELRLIPGSFHCFDGELSSPLVRRVLEQRIAAMRRMTEA